jgi:cell division protein FtsW
MNRKFRSFAGGLEQTDRWLIGSLGALVLLGIIVVFGAGSYSKPAAYSPLGQQYVLIKHLVTIFIGSVVMLILMHVDYHHYRRKYLTWSGVIITLFLVGLTLVQGGDRVINRWLVIGPIRFQPVEMAKLAMIIFVAHNLTSHPQGARISGRRFLATLTAPLALIIILVLQPNFGNVMVLGGVTVAMLFVLGLPLRWLASGLGVMIAAAALAFMVVSKLQTRLDLWLQGLLNGDYGYQVDQSLVGLGAGGWRGLGIGQSHNKFNFLPESHTDFAFSVLGEEFGIFGTLLVIILLVVLTWRGFNIAARAIDPFGKAIATGLTTGLAIYGVANIGMVTGVFPVVGVPLPFVSFGGTAMVAGFAAVGILLNIQKTQQDYSMMQARWQRRSI